MQLGTRSLMFGVHQIFLHGITVAYAWYKTWGFPKDIRLWFAFFLHDIGYFGKPNMDGEEGSRHPELGAKIMEKMFGKKWGDFTLCHSGRYAKMNDLEVSKLYVADKMAMYYTPKWLYLILANFSGEIKEYLEDWSWEGTQSEWFDECSRRMSQRAYIEKIQFI